MQEQSKEFSILQSINMTDKKYALIVPMRTIVRILETSAGLIERKQES